jgi:hypothetical protein
MKGPDIRVRIRRFGGLSEHLFPQEGWSPGFENVHRRGCFGPCTAMPLGFTFQRWGRERPRGRPLSRFLMDRVEMEEGLHGSPSPRILAVSATAIMSPMPRVKAHSSWR